MKLIAAVITGILVLGLSGCARMSVQVDILDRRGLSAEEALESRVGWSSSQHELASSRGEYARRLEIILDALTAQYRILVAKTETTAEDMDEGLQSARRSVGAALSRLAAERDGASRRYQRALLLRASQRQREMKISNDEFALALSRWDAFYAKIEHTFDGDAKAIAVLQSSLRGLQAGSRLTQAGKMQLDLLTAGQGLFDDPYAAFVVNAPESNWKGLYNRAHGSGVGGNTDLAIKMEGPGMFTVKGLKQDGSKLAQASLQTLKQGVRMVGVAYGLPLGALAPSLPAAPDVGAVLAPLAELSPPGLSRRATVDLLDRVLDEQGALASASPAQRRVALERIAAELPAAFP